MNTRELIALDTSTAVPLLMKTHPARAMVKASLRGKHPVLTSHSLAETYSVLTRLAGDARLEPADASLLITREFGSTVVIDEKTVRSLTETLSTRGIAGGAVYDALVALAAQSAGLRLLTRDTRASGTYAAIGVQVEMVLG
ncbi:MAG: PIN domain-containing protein [Rhodoglobus sp.]